MNKNQLAYEVHGSGETVVLIHAFPLSKKMWAEQVRLLAKKYQVVTVDLPGFGQSPPQSRPSIALWAQAVALVLDELKIAGPVFIGGLSMGGYVVFEFFRQFPTRVRALGLFSTRAKPDTEDQKKKRGELAREIREAGLGALANSMPAKLVGKSTETSAPRLLAELKSAIEAGSSQGTADALLAMAERADSSDLLEKICVPALIVAGAEDKVIPVSEAGDMQKKISGSDLHVLEKTGHMVNLEQTEIFNTLIENFLQKVFS